MMENYLKIETIIGEEKFEIVEEFNPNGRSQKDIILAVEELAKELAENITIYIFLNGKMEAIVEWV